MRVLYILLLLAGGVSSLSGQTDLQELLSSSTDFAATVSKAEAYFRAKHPGLDAEKLSRGEFRDGEFVKFMRWKHYWSERLNPDGSFADPLQVHRARKSDVRLKSANPYVSVPWTEINYTDYIVGQIGLGRTTSIGFHPTDANTFYVGAAIGGIWRTTDGGQSYVPLGDDLPFMAVSAIVVERNNPNTLYIAVSDHVWYGPAGIGVYKSTNGGTTWQPTSLSFSFGQNIRIYDMVASPINDQEMYVATANGLYKTTDGFGTVDLILAGDCRDVALKPGDTATIYVGQSDGVLQKSTDGGSGFTQLRDFGNGEVLLDVTPLNDQLVYARSGSSLYLSADGGASFPVVRSLPEGGMRFRIAPNDEDVVIMGNFDVFRSDNSGANIRQISHWLGSNGLPLVHVDLRNAFVNPLENDAVYLCNDGGVYRYNISSGTFDNLCDGLAITQYYDIAVAQTDANIIGGGSQDNGNVYRQSNGSWLQYASTGDGMNQEIDPTDAGIRYWSYQNGGLQRWMNGINQNIKPPGSTTGAWETPYKLDPSNPSRLVAGFTNVWESMDRGNSWTVIGSSLNGGGLMDELAIAPSNGERIYVTSGGNLYVKDLADDTWTPRSLPNGSVSDIEVDPLDMNTIYVSVPGYGSGQKVYKSMDAGASWLNISGSLPNVSFGALELYHDVPGGIFVGSDAGVFYRDDQLSDWLEYGDLPNTRVEDIEVQYAAGLLRVGTHGRGVLEAPIIIESCGVDSPDGDNDGTCDAFDFCPAFDNNLIGSPCDDGDDFSSGEVYDTNCGCSGGRASLNYCFAEGAAGTGGDYINAVSLNGIDQTSGQSQYSDFRSVIFPVNIGESYTLSTSLAAIFPPDRIHAWVDWNRDGQFSADEHIDMSIPSGSGSTGTVSVPEYAEEGVTTMRVRAVYSTTHNDPCGSAFGEVEDYTLNVSCAAGAGQCAFLPLNWGGFTARPIQKGAALLHWTTFQESNVSRFLVERSTDGRAFEIVGEVPALNEVMAAYDYTDTGVGARHAYYRIAALDLDGNRSVSPVERVFWRSDVASVHLYPNPADHSGLNLRWVAQGPGDVTAIVYNTYGQEVRKQRLGGAGENGLTGSRQETISTSGLPAGVYLLRMRGKAWDWTGSFVIK